MRADLRARFVCVASSQYQLLQALFLLWTFRSCSRRVIRCIVVCAGTQELTDDHNIRSPTNCYALFCHARLERGRIGSTRSRTWASLRCPRHESRRDGLVCGRQLCRLEESAAVFRRANPSELGGGDASYEEMCQLLRMLAGYCGSTALALSMHSHLVAAIVWKRGHLQAPVDSLL